MTDGDNERENPRRPPAGQSTGSVKSPIQEIPRPSGDPARSTSDGTGQTAAIASDSPPIPLGGPVITPSDAERRKAEKAAKARQKAAGRATRRAAARRPRQTRRAKLRLSRVDPWSVTKTAFLLSIAFGVMCVVAVFLVFSIMDAAGLWDKVNSTIQSVVNQDRGSQFDIKDYVAMSRVMGITMLISVIDVVLITALATLGAFIYNMSAAMLGGIEVTLAEDLD
jgi:hypothetical protein